MRLLVLGGTAFLGRAIVEHALRAGHEVTLFNRGRTNPGLFPAAEELRGDRNEDLSALAGREWDAVVDVATFLPRAVRLSTEALRGRVERYTYVSSISAYADLGRPPVEDAPLARLDDEGSERIEDYGPLKAACERIALAAFPGHAFVVRPGLIVGPHDPTDRFTWWPRRIAEGGQVVAPLPRDRPVQVVDVRDLGRWIVDATAAGTTGVFNATGPETPFERFLEECIRLAGPAELVWLPPEQLLEAGVGEWLELPLWVASPEYACLMRVPVERAIGAGLRIRPLAETIRDTLEWDRSREFPRAEGIGLTPERERALLAAAPDQS